MHEATGSCTDVLLEIRLISFTQVHSITPDSDISNPRSHLEHRCKARGSALQAGDPALTIASLSLGAPHQQGQRGQGQTDLQSQHTRNPGRTAHGTVSSITSSLFDMVSTAATVYLSSQHHFACTPPSLYDAIGIGLGVCFFPELLKRRFAVASARKRAEP